MALFSLLPSCSVFEAGCFPAFKKRIAAVSISLFALGQTK